MQSKYICVAVAKELPRIADYSFHTLISLKSVTESLSNLRFLLRQGVFPSSELIILPYCPEQRRQHCNIFTESTWIGRIFCGFKVDLVTSLTFNPSWSLNE